MKRVKADGVYYYNTKGGLTQETFSETLAHERIDNLFKYIDSLRTEDRDLKERVEKLEDFHYKHRDPTAHYCDKPHTCGECEFVIEDYPYKIGFRLFCWRHEDGRYKYMVRDRMQACEKFKLKGKV